MPIVPRIPATARIADFSPPLSMLAASTGVSNVPPDDLQTPPVVAFSTRPSQRLRKDRAGPGPQTDPPPAPQQDAAIQKACWAPFAVGTENHDAPVGTDSQAQAVDPGSAQSQQFPARETRPGSAAREQQSRRPGQRRDHDEAASGKAAARAQYDAAQLRVRPEFGEVCDR